MNAKSYTKQQLIDINAKLAEENASLRAELSKAKVQSEAAPKKPSVTQRVFTTSRRIIVETKDKAWAFKARAQLAAKLACKVCVEPHIVDINGVPTTVYAVY